MPQQQPQLLTEWWNELIQRNDDYHPLPWKLRELLNEIGYETITRIWEVRGRPDPNTKKWKGMWDDITILIDDMVNE
jgi:hypothetical protein